MSPKPGAAYSANKPVTPVNADPPVWTSERTRRCLNGHCQPFVIVTWRRERLADVALIHQGDRRCAGRTDPLDPKDW